MPKPITRSLSKRIAIIQITIILVNFLCLTLYVTTNVSGSQLSDKIYTNLQSNHYCSRRLNATNQVGCTSDLGGNYGIVWLVEERGDIDHILRTGPTPPYMVLLRRFEFTRENILKFKNNPERVSGVVFLDIDHEDSSLRSNPYSPDDTCPNRYSGLYANDSVYQDCKVNSWQRESPVSGLLHDDIPFPIFLINDKNSYEELMNCLEHNVQAGPRQTSKKQASHPLCGMQLDSFMLAAGDSENCLNSHSLVDDLLQSNGRRCTPVHNENIFGFLKPAFGPLKPSKYPNYFIPEMVEPQTIVMLAIKLSSLSMFSDMSPGADSTITSIITSLAIAEALGKVRNNSAVSKSKRNIAFAYLDSEPFDYTGSSNMVASMQTNSFPREYILLDSSQNVTDGMKNMNLESIDYIINLDQLANYPNSSDIYLHVDPSDNNQKLNELVRILKEFAPKEGVNFKTLDSSMPLPPAPVHTFIKASRSEKVQRKLHGSVLSGYGKIYNNLFYNSIYDDSHNIYQVSQDKLVEHLARVATFIAKSIHKLAFESDQEDIIANKTLIRELLGCYLKDAKCDLFTKAWQAGQQLPSGPIQTYKEATKRSDDMNGLITRFLLAYFLGDKITDLNSTKCYEANIESAIYNYQYINGQKEPVRDGSSGVCIRSQVMATSALSPAFQREEDTITVDSRYPAWTASLNGIRNPVRIYMKPSPLHQWLVFIMGIVVTILSFLVVHHVRKSLSKLETTTEPQPGTSSR